MGPPVVASVSTAIGQEEETTWAIAYPTRMVLMPQTTVMKHHWAKTLYISCYLQLTLQHRKTDKFHSEDSWKSQGHEPSPRETLALNPATVCSLQHSFPKPWLSSGSTRHQTYPELWWTYTCHMYTFHLFLMFPSISLLYFTIFHAHLWNNSKETCPLLLLINHS